MKGAMAVAMEVETTRKAKRRYVNILETYTEQKKTKHLWYLVKDKSLGDFIAEALDKVETSKPNQWLLWSEISEVLHSPRDFRFYSLGGELDSREMLDLSSASGPPESAHTPAHTVGSSDENEEFLEEVTL